MATHLYLPASSNRRFIKVRALVFTPMALDGTLPLRLSQLYPDAPSASQVKEAFVKLLPKPTNLLMGFSVMTGGFPINKITPCVNTHTPSFAIKIIHTIITRLEDSYIDLVHACYSKSATASFY